MLTSIWRITWATNVCLIALIQTAQGEPPSATVEIERDISLQPLQQLKVIGEMAPRDQMQKLREMGDKVPPEYQVAGWGNEPWRHTAHSYGFISPPKPSSPQQLDIVHAGNMEADAGLRNSRIKITLDRLRVADYPGGNDTHVVLFDFYGQNQVAENAAEHLHFAKKFRAREGEEAAVIGYPVFIGLKVGREGVSFNCFTVNVANENDEKFLAFLDGDVFKTGLQLLNTAQPALAPLSGMALGITKSIAQRHRNVPVQDFFMGLDFSNLPGRARLAEGTYIAVQIPQNTVEAWNWNEWVYDRSSGQVVQRSDATKRIPYNYVVFSISKYDGT